MMNGFTGQNPFKVSVLLVWIDVKTQDLEV